MNAPPLRLRVLGPLSVELEGRRVAGFISDKVAFLLVYLALRGRPQARGALAELLWPDAPAEKARASLRTALHNLRKLVGARLVVERDRVALERGERWIDAEALEAGEGDGLSLCRGELLEGIAVGDAPEAAAWLDGERARLSRVALERLERAVADAERAGETERALRTAERMVEVEPLDEAAHRRLMLLLARRGEANAALAQYERCERALAEHLDVPPMPQTRALVERIRTARACRVSRPAARAPELVGRDDVLGELAELLRDQQRCALQIVGGAGTGKSALARASVERAGQRWLHGAVWVSLDRTGARTRGDLVSAIATALGSATTGRKSEADLLDALAAREVLLVLDGFEGLAGEADFLGSVLEAAPEVDLLVTTRARLKAPGLEARAVRGLDEESAIRLLERLSAEQERAAAVPRDALLRVARAVGGNPLALEVCAALARAVPWRVLARSLSGSLELLYDPPPGAAAPGLAAVLEHSWGALDRRERECLMALSVFRGGFEPGAAERVAGAGARTLVSLVDNSLLERTRDRLEPHELVHQLAADRLARSGRERDVRDAHAGWIADRLEQWEDALWGEGQRDVRREADEEIGNVRVAWRWMIDSERRSLLERGLGGLYERFFVESANLEGEELLGAAQSVAEPDTRLGARIRARRARFLIRLGEVDRALAWLEAARRLFSRLGDTHEEAFCLNYLGVARYVRGEHQKARAHLTASAALWERVERADRVAFAHANLGNAEAALDRIAEARSCFRRALDRFEVAGIEWGICGVRCQLAELAIDQGSLDEATAHLDASLELAVAAHFPNVLMDGWALRARLANAEGDERAARTFFERSLALAEQHGNPIALARACVSLGELASRSGDIACGFRLFDRAASVARRAGDRGREALCFAKMARLAARRRIDGRFSELAAEARRLATPLTRARVESALAE